MADKFKRLFPELSQGTDVPIEEQQYDAPREIGGAPKPIEAVVPRILTDSITGIPGMAAGALRNLYNYYPEKIGPSTKTQTTEAKIPDWLLQAVTHPEYENTDEGKKAIDYATKNLTKKEQLVNKLSMREEQQLKDKANEFITHADQLPHEIPLADEGSKLIRNKDNPYYQQGYDLITPKGDKPDWITVSKDRDSIPSVSYLKELPKDLKGNALAAQAYTALAKEYGTLRSDPTAITSPMIKKAFWNQFGQPLDPTWDNKDRFEVPFRVNAAEQMAPIKNKYANLIDKANDERELLDTIASKNKQPFELDESPSERRSRITRSNMGLPPISKEEIEQKFPNTDDLMNQWLYGIPASKKK